MNSPEIADQLTKTGVETPWNRDFNQKLISNKLREAYISVDKVDKGGKDKNKIVNGKLGRAELTERQPAGTKFYVLFLSLLVNSLKSSQFQV
jgi:hypothetical protein